MRIIEIPGKDSAGRAWRVFVKECGCQAEKHVAIEVVGRQVSEPVYDCVDANDFLTRHLPSAHTLRFTVLSVLKTEFGLPEGAFEGPRKCVMAANADAAH